MNRLLITGASGFLGWHLCQKAKFRWQVYGTYFSHALTPINLTLIKADLRDFQSLKSLLAQIQPIGVIHTAAQSNPNICQQSPEETYRINVTAAANLAALCADTNTPYLFTSTDLVFDGTQPPYQESDPVSPLSYYGEQKAIAEQKILSCHPQATICRMPLMFGASPTADSFIQPFIKTLKAGQALKLFVDEVRTPVSASTAAEGLLLALKIQGLLHLGGKERLSRYEFGRLMVKVLNLPEDRLKPCRQQDIIMAAPRPPDVSLDSSKAFKLGYQPLLLKEELQALAKDLV